MKKSITMLVAGLMSLTLAACSAPAPSATPAPTAAASASAKPSTTPSAMPSATPAATPAVTASATPAATPSASASAAAKPASNGKKLYIIASSDTGPFWTPLVAAAKERGAQSGYELVVRTGVSGDPARPQKMLEATQEGIDQKAVAIGLSAIDPDMFNRKAKEAQDAGIKVIAFDTDIKSPENRKSYVGTNNFEAGVTLGTKAAADLKAKGIKSGKISTMVFSGSTQNMIDRIKGAKEGFAKEMGADNANFKWLELIINDNNAGEGKRQFEAQIVANPELNVIFTFGVESVITGTMEAIRSQNKAGKIFHYGFDYSPTFEIGIKDGLITGIVDQDCKAIGTTLVDTMIAAAEGKEIKPVYPINVNWVEAKDIMAYGAKKMGK